MGSAARCSKTAKICPSMVQVLLLLLTIHGVDSIFCMLAVTAAANKTPSFIDYFASADDVIFTVGGRISLCLYVLYLYVHLCSFYVYISTCYRCV